jgi:hypothetical protein
VSDETPRLRQIEELPEAPSDPGEIHSAARSCSVILIIGAVLLLIVCVLLVATVVRH